jgi:hypothetical protein
MRNLIIAAALFISSAASAGGIMFLHVGQADGSGTSGTCSPGSATGSVDLSQCSNALYAAIIF